MKPTFTIYYPSKWDFDECSESFHLQSTYIPYWHRWSLIDGPWSVLINLDLRSL